MKRSIFCYLFSYKNKKYIIHTKNKKIYEIDNDTYNMFLGDVKSLAHHKDVSLFKENFFLIEDSIDEVKNLENAFIKADDDDSWNSLHIIPTTNCNMKCEYCFVMKDMEKGFPHKNLSEETLYKTIDFYVNNNTSKKNSMSFYGGEPFVNKKIVFEAVQYANKHYPGFFQYKIVTNGTLITEEIATFLKDNSFDVNLSLDGNIKAQNYFRVYDNRKSTYNDVVNGLQVLMRCGNSVKVLVTVGAHNIDYLDDCVNSILEFKPTSIALNLPKKLQKVNSHLEDGLDYDRVWNMYKKCLDICYENSIPEAHFADIIYGFLSDEIHYRPCNGCGKQIVISPYNKVGPCQAYLSTGKYFVDFENVTDKKMLRQTPEFSKWKNITMYNCSKCRNCYLLPICPGDCPFDWENREGNFDNPPSGYCYTRKKCLMS